MQLFQGAVCEAFDSFTHLRTMIFYGYGIQLRCSNRIGHFESQTIDQSFRSMIVLKLTHPDPLGRTIHDWFPAPRLIKFNFYSDYEWWLGEVSRLSSWACCNPMVNSG